MLFDYMFLFLFTSAFFTTLYIGATDFRNKVGIGISLFSFAALLMLIVANLIVDDYKQGQIDALTGKIKYERITHPDSTVTWEKIKGIEE